MPEQEKAYLYLRFKCGHLRKLTSASRLHYWLDNARRSLCAECIEARASRNPPPYTFNRMREAVQ